MTSHQHRQQQQVTVVRVHSPNAFPTEPAYPPPPLPPGAHNHGGTTSSYGAAQQPHHTPTPSYGSSHYSTQSQHGTNAPVSHGGPPHHHDLTPQGSHTHAASSSSPYVGMDVPATSTPSYRDVNLTHHHGTSSQQEDPDRTVQQASEPSPANHRQHTASSCSQDDGEPPPLGPSGSYNDDESSSSEEDDPLVREYLERQDIVDKYNKGPEGQQVDPWENPDFEIYKITDTHGFMHDSEADVFDDTGGHAGGGAAAKAERLRLERSRDVKWLRMLDDWPRTVRQGTKLRSRVWKGVPNKLRSTVWMELLHVKESLSTNAGVYEALLKRAELLSKDLKQIDLDINRTYRDHLFFRKRYDIKQRSLFNVLVAYSMYNTEVGYCQGMSQLAALLLMYMDEENAFWALHRLMCSPPHAMHGFFIPGFPKLMRFQSLFEKILSKYLPRLKRHIDKMQIPAIYTTKWFFGCFLDRVPFTIALRLWDVFLLEGDSILLAMAYNVMKMHMKTLKKLNFEQTLGFIQDSLAKDFGFPDNVVMESLGDCLKKLRSDRMDGSRVLEPNLPNELPTKQYGMVLRRKLNEIETEVFEITSRASRNRSRRPSRLNLNDSSLSATPRLTRRKSREDGINHNPGGGTPPVPPPSKKQQTPVKPTLSNDARTPANGGFTPVDGGTNRRHLPASPPSPAPISTTKPPLPSGGGASIERQVPVRTPSVYDNMTPEEWGAATAGLAPVDNGDAAAFEATEERRSYERYSSPDAGAHGGLLLNAQLTTRVTRVETTRTTTTRPVSSLAAAGHQPPHHRHRPHTSEGGPMTTPATVSRGPDHVTYVRVENDHDDRRHRPQQSSSSFDSPTRHRQTTGETARSVTPSGRHAWASTTTTNTMSSKQTEV